VYSYGCSRPTSSLLLSGSVVNLLILSLSAVTAFENFGAMFYTVLFLPSPRTRAGTSEALTRSFPQFLYKSPSSQQHHLYSSSPFQPQFSPNMQLPLYALTATFCRGAWTPQERHHICRDICTFSLSRIQERDHVVKARAYLGESLLFYSIVHGGICAESTLDEAFVLSQAQALDPIPPDQRGPLHGLAIGVKDVMNTKGIMWSLCSIKMLMSPRYAYPIWLSHLQTDINQALIHQQ